MTESENPRINAQKMSQNIPKPEAERLDELTGDSDGERHRYILPCGELTASHLR
jgi:hypothetical protein